MPLIAILGGAGLAFGIGFATGGEGLDPAALGVYEGLLTWACWMVSMLADLMMWIVVKVFQEMPGGFLEPATTDWLTDRMNEAEPYLPLQDAVELTETFIAFLAAYVPLRLVLRLMPWIA